MKNSKTVITALIASGLTILLLWIINDKPFSEENTAPSPEKIVELMGNQTSFGVKGNCGMCKKQ